MSRSSSWRRALLRLGLAEDARLPLAHLAARLVSAGERNAAVDAYRELLEASPDDVPALQALAALHAQMGRVDEEIPLRRRLVTLTVERMGLAPEDREAAIAYEMAALGVGEAPPQMPAAYVAALFDGYAERFDAHLREGLGYRGPELVHAALARAIEDPPRPRAIGDIGCGTGLLGPLLRPFASRLIGVDRSSGMLEKARARGVYDELIEGDLIAVLQGCPGAFDVVTAADVLIYLGDLGPVFVAVAIALREHGLFSFTIESSDDADVRLTGDGRYAHSSAHVRAAAAAAGLREISAEEAVLRKERGRPVASMVHLLRKE
jgi:predicted TPR repeat methyltransferase